MDSWHATYAAAWALRLEARYRIRFRVFVTMIKRIVIGSNVSLDDHVPVRSAMYPRPSTIIALTRPVILRVGAQHFETSDGTAEHLRRQS